MGTTTRATIADLEKIEGRCELVNGEIVMMTPAGGRHGWIGSEMLTMINVHVRSKRLGRVFNAETGFIVSRDPDTVRAPDVAFVSAARLHGVDDIGYLPFPPDLAVEVVSPSDSYSEVKAKARMWLDAGTTLVWIVDPTDRQVESMTATSARELTDKDVLDGAPVLPELRIDLRELFS